MAKKSDGAGSGGWVSLPEKFRTSFPRDMFEKKFRGGYRVGDAYTNPYRGDKFGIKNPYSPLNIKINGAQKYFLQKEFEGKDSMGRSKFSSLNLTWLRKHLISVTEKISINALNFSVILSLRAQKIFQDSFKYKRFYSADGAAWAPLKPSTIKKRQRKRTWPGAGGMLREYGDMYKSVKARRGDKGKFIGSVYTDPSDYVRHNYTDRYGMSRVDKRGVFCYAGLHNEGGRIRGKYRLPKRQFMGHSTYLLDFALQQADRYFFFNVFD